MGIFKWKIRYKCSSEKIVWNQKWQNELWIEEKINSAVRIMAQAVFPKKLFTSRKAGTGRKAVSEPLSVFHGSCLWQAIKVITCGPLPVTELLFYKRKGHSMEQGLAS